MGPVSHVENLCQLSILFEYIYLSTIFPITHSANVCMPTLVHLQFLIEAEWGTKETGLHSVLTVTGVGMMEEENRC